MHEELVRQAQQGDAEAFDSLARMSGDRCLAIAVRILRDIDLAEDAVQAALITAWTELRALRDPSRFEPWLHRAQAVALWVAFPCWRIRIGFPNGSRTPMSVP